MTLYVFISDIKIFNILNVFIFDEINEEGGGLLASFISPNWEQFIIEDKETLM